ncbi:MAG TPA: hypothetical protein VJT71_10480 [Pyrinomonadaceae bacterium]|nr:hypothetical protein [Pyrinomonadaceae bacterium]
MTLTRQITLALAAVLAVASTCWAQKQRPDPVCSQTTAAAFKPLPQLTYECPDEPNDSDEAILKLPQRLRAIKALEAELAALSNAAWWQADVDNLNACAFKETAGELTDEQKEAWKRGDYRFQLFGSHDIRLALIDDPCYQTGFNGSNAFLLVRKGGKVFVTQVLDGYYSRVDNSVGIEFANLNGQQLIEVSTANSMPPSLLYHYFVIDPKTNRAMPKKIFREDGKLTNQVWSAMLLGESKSAPELKIISRRRLNRTFSAYRESDRGRIDDGGRRLRRIVYRWNGRFYSAN